MVSRFPKQWGSTFPQTNSKHPGLDKRVSLCYDESIHDVQGTLVQNQGLELAEAVIKSSNCHGKPTIFGGKYNQNIFGTFFPRHSQQKPNRRQTHHSRTPSCPLLFLGGHISASRQVSFSAFSAKEPTLLSTKKRRKSVDAPSTVPFPHQNASQFQPAVAGTAPEHRSC